MAEVGISLLPESLIKYLPHLKKLDLRSNQLSILPDEKYFVNLQNMVFVRLQGNPLRCDSGLAWIKVDIKMCVDRESASLWNKYLICQLLHIHWPQLDGFPN